MYLDLILTMLRVIINDFNDPEVYSDSRLKQVIMVAAAYIKQEILLPTSYTIDVVGQTITPDPTNDVVFINMATLKAACLVDQGNYRTQAMVAGIVAKCGPAEIQTMNYLKGFLDLFANGPCKAYEDLKMQQNFGDGINLQVIMSPFINKNLNPAFLGAFNYGERYSFFNQSE